MNQHPVAGFDRNFCEVFVRAMHRVAGLKRRNLGPSHLLKKRPGLGWRFEQLTKALSKVPSGQHLDPPCEVDIALLHDQLDARMRRVGGQKDALAFMGLVNAVFFRHLHGGQERAVVRIDERDL